MFNLVDVYIVDFVKEVNCGCVILVDMVMDKFKMLEGGLMV